MSAGGPGGGGAGVIRPGWLAAAVGTAAAVSLFVGLGPQGLARHFLASAGVVLGLMAASWAVARRLNEGRR